MLQKSPKRKNSFKPAKIRQHDSHPQSSQFSVQFDEEIDWTQAMEFNSEKNVLPEEKVDKLPEQIIICDQSQSHSPSSNPFLKISLDQVKIVEPIIKRQQKLVAVQLTDNMLAGVDFSGDHANLKTLDHRSELIAQAIKQGDINVQVFDSETSGNPYRDFLPLELECLLDYAKEQIPAVSLQVCDSLNKNGPHDPVTVNLLSTRLYFCLF
jgi:hypothetical protein